MHELVTDLLSSAPDTLLYSADEFVTNDEADGESDATDGAVVAATEEAAE